MEPPASETDLMITGSQLAALSADQAEFDKAIERCLVFAKISPQQKLQVVKGLRKGGGGRAVAFLGDGVNDALAIRAADVGISVDSGTEIAKEAADVILLEKGLDVIAHGILQGRMTCVLSLFLNSGTGSDRPVGSSILLNTSKWPSHPTLATSFPFLVITFLDSTVPLLRRMKLMLVHAVASAWLPYEPIRPIQLLFQNLLYDFSQATIPWSVNSSHPYLSSIRTDLCGCGGINRDNVDPEYLAAPKTWNAMSLARFMIVLGPTSSVFDVCIFLLNWCVLHLSLSYNLHGTLILQQVSIRHSTKRLP